MGGGKASESSANQHSSPQRSLDDLKVILGAIPKIVVETLKAHEEAKEEKVAVDRQKEALATCICAHLGVSKLPEPLLMRNPQVLKEPATWLACFEKRGLTRAMVMDSEGNDGPVIQDFQLKLRSLFGDLDAEDLCDLLLRTTGLFKAIAIMFLYHPTELGPQDLLQCCEGALTEAKRLVGKLDVGLIREKAGEKAASAFRTNRDTLNSHHFAVSDAEALKSIRHKRAVSSDLADLGTGPGTRYCNKCGEEVVEGYKAHNKRCRLLKKLKKE